MERCSTMGLWCFWMYMGSCLTNRAVLLRCHGPGIVAVNQQRRKKLWMRRCIVAGRCCKTSLGMPSLPEALFLCCGNRGACCTMSTCGNVCDQFNDLHPREKSLLHSCSPAPTICVHTVRSCKDRRGWQAPSCLFFEALVLGALRPISHWQPARQGVWPSYEALWPRW